MKKKAAADEEKKKRAEEAAARIAAAKKKAEEDAKVDKTLRDTFPASDPPSTNTATGREPPPGRIDRKPPVITPEPIAEHKPHNSKHEKHGNR